MSLSCPHCRSVVDLPADGAVGVMDCPSCGKPLPASSSETEALHREPAGSSGTDTAESNSRDVTPPVVSPRSSPATASRPETELANCFGDYEILEEVARGGMGVVYKARHVPLNRLVALKLIRFGDIASDAEVRRFQTEAEAAARLDHPNIVPVHEFGRVEGQPYFSMGFVEGESLQRRLANGPLPGREAAGLFIAIAEAVQFAHDRGVIHRDLKPANVLIDAQGQPRVTDFGLAKRTDTESSLTRTGDVMGTPGYMPPEQAAGRIDQVDHLSDVYSLGSTLYCAITGRPPFQAATGVETLKQVMEREPVPPRALNPAVDADLETICMKCLQKEPPRRYASARDLADDLRRYIDGRSIIARPVSAAERGWRWCRRNPTVAALSAAFTLSLIVGSIVAGYFAVTANQKAEDLDDALTRETTARKAAEANEQRANTLFQHALKNNVAATELAEQLKQIAGTRSDSVRRILEHILTGYDELLAAGERSPELLQGKAKLLIAFSDVYLELGDSSKALQMIREARRIVKQLPSTASPDKALSAETRTVLLADAGTQLGRILGVQGHLNDGLRALQTAEMQWNELCKRHPNNVEYRKGSARCRTRLGQLYSEMGNFYAALSAFRQSLQEYQRLVDGHPGDVGLRASLATAFANVGGAASSLSFYPESKLPDYRKAAQQYRRVLKEDPDNPRYWKSYAQLLAGLAWSVKSNGRYSEAHRLLDEAQRIAEKYGSLDPANMDWHRLLLQVRFYRLDIPGERQPKDAARQQLQTLQKLHEAARKLAMRDSNDVTKQLDVPRTRVVWLIRRLATVGNDNAGRQTLQAILKDFAAAKKEVDRIAQEFPSFWGAVSFLSTIAMAEAEIHQRLGNAAAAMSARESIHSPRIAYLKRMHKLHPQQEGWTRRLAKARNDHFYVLLNSFHMLRSVGMTDLAKQRGQLAEQSLSNAEMLIDELLKTHPKDYVLRRVRAKFHSDRGMFAFLQDDNAESFTEFQKTGVLLEQLSQQRPQDIELLKEIAAQYRELAGRFALLERPRKETAMYRKHLDLRLRILQLSPKELKTDPLQPQKVGSRIIQSIRGEARKQQVSYAEQTWNSARLKLTLSKDLRSKGEFIQASIVLVRLLRPDDSKERDLALTVLTAGLELLREMKRNGSIHPVHERLIPFFEAALQRFQQQAGNTAPVRAERPAVIAPRP